MGKSDQIGEIYVICRMLKLFRHYVWAQAEFHKVGPASEKPIDPVLVFIYGEQQKI